MSTQEQRERFEAFAIRRNMGAERISCGRYKSSFTQAMFESWLAAEAAAIERCAKALYGRLMRQDVGFEEAHLSLNVGGVPPTEHEFVEAIRALLPKEES